MACRDCKGRELSKRQDPEGWRDMEMGSTTCGKCARFQKTSQPFPDSGICRWKSKEPLPNAVIDRAPYIVSGDEDGEGCPQFKPREGGVMGRSDDRCEHLVRFPMKGCVYCVRTALAAAQSRIAELERMNSALRGQVDFEQTRIAELERMVVWCVNHGAEVEGDRMWWFRMLSEDSGNVDTDCDGTPASILAAVEKAMGKRCES